MERRNDLLWHSVPDLLALLLWDLGLGGITGREPMAVNLGVTWQDSETLADDIATALNLFIYSF